MSCYDILKIREHKELIEPSCAWFHHKWGISQEIYRESMIQCAKQNIKIPQWYIVLDGKKIIAGLGVIENDFHHRKDLSPNVCAVYVEDAYRKQKIAGKMLDFVCEDLHCIGIDTLYLITDHTSFYEQYDWEFLCMVQADGEPKMTRMYIHEHQ